MVHKDLACQDVKMTAVSFVNGHTTPIHSHCRGQLVYAVSGVMEVTVGSKQWRVPPQRGVWIPPGLPHAMLAHGPVELRSVYIAPDLLSLQFANANVPIMIAISPLLRELILRTIENEQSCRPIELHDQIVDLAVSELELLLKESAGMPEYILPLPSGSDKRITKICDTILKNPGHPYGLEDWANKVCTSKSTLARRFRAEFGMSFLTWRQQVRVASALSRLDQGVPVTVIASDLGYETPAAFSLMFRKLTGLTPSSYASTTGAHSHVMDIL